MKNRYLTECEQVVMAAAGRELSDDELENVFSGLEKNIKQYRAENASLTLEEAAVKAADSMIRDDAMAKIIAAHNKAINLNIRTRLEDYLNRSKELIGADRPDLALSALLVSRNEAAPGFRASAAREQIQLEGKYLAGFEQDLHQAGLTKVLASGEYDQEIADAMWRLGNGQPIDGLSQNSVKLAQIIDRWQEVARVDSNKAGAFIGKLAGYITRQSHDWLKIRKAGFENWLKDIQPRLDERTFTDVGDRVKFLRDIYTGLASGVHLSHDSTNWMSGFEGGGNLAKRMSQSRVLHFKNGLAWHEYNQRYGVGSLRESVISGLSFSAKNTGVMRVLGTNPEQMFNYLFHTQQERLHKSGNAEKLIRFTNTQRVLNNQLAEVLGKTNIPANATWARIGATARAVQNITKLGKALLSSFTDIPNAAMELRYQGMNVLEVLMKSMTARLPQYQKSEQKEILRAMGIFSDAMRDEVIAKFGGDTSIPGKIAGAQRLYFKLNLLNWWTESGRRATGLMLSNWLANNAAHPWEKINKELQRSLNASGISEAEWQLYRSMKFDTLHGNPHMTPLAVQHIPEARIADYVQSQGLKVMPVSIDAARESLAGKLRGYYLDRILAAQSEPGARTRATMKQGTQAGSPIGEALRFGGQFKSFTASFMHQSIGRELFGRGYIPRELDESIFKSLANALRHGNGELMGMAQLIVGMTVFGYIGMQSKLLLNGQTPRPFSKETFWAAMAQGGGAGVLSDFLFGEVNRFGGGLAGTLAGPLVGDIDQLHNLYLQARDGDAKAADAVRFIIDHTPYLNLHIVRPTMNYLILNRLQETLSPGMLNRYQQRVETEQGNRFLIPPSQFMLGK